jgi:hypothetical protein
MPELIFHKLDPIGSCLQWAPKRLEGYSISTICDNDFHTPNLQQMLKFPL